jgi:uncharacterized membrane protein (DUF4010 family)
MEHNAFIQLAVSLLLGLLVGLQRERTESAVAGIRTFPLITAFGTMCAWLSESQGGWVIAGGLIALGGVIVTANFVRVKSGDIDPGITTELAILLLFGVGAYLVVGQMAVAVALGGVIALLLHWKKPMHNFVATIGEPDIRAIMQFVLVTLVILPVLPNRSYGPYSVLNPFKIWLFVVLVVGLSLSGYLIFKFFGQRVGVWLGGVLGGFISSTATTVTYARRTAENGSARELAALVIMIASAILYLRVLIFIGVVASGKFASMAPPFAAMLVACAIIAGVYSQLVRKHTAQMPMQKNPAQLKSALIIGALYAIISFGVAAARDHFGTRGLYTAAVLSGLTDMDAITLSTAQLASRDALDTNNAWRVILVASLSNFFFKAGVVAWVGDRRLLKTVSILFGAAILTGGAILWLWPV